jgi:ABC-type Fe3+/spermidine/putrescine transport system ATPase subunit
MVMTEGSLSIRRLSKRFGAFAAVDSLNLAVEHGEIMAILGPSGCGKTTTLRMVAGLERPTEGGIRFGDKHFVSSRQKIELPPEQRNIGMVFQSYALWPHMTVFENIAYPLKLRSYSRAEIGLRVKRVLELINLAHLAERTIPQLSGGQQQRIALARALVYEPSLMLFDEPFSNLDTQLREQMRLELKSLRRKVTMTGLFVTHDQVEALSLADRVAIMRNGKLEQVGTPRDVYRTPANKFVRDFLGRAVKLYGHRQERNGQYGVRLSDEAGTLILGQFAKAENAASERIELSIRPEFVTWLDESETRENCVVATIEDLLFAGEHCEARLRIGPDTVLFALPSNRSWAEGQKVRFHLPPEAVSFWPDED